jgi:regulatory protein SWI5
MCIGAFEGVVKKTVKRGRPRKNRPDDEERLKKSSRTRSKNKTTSSASSTTSYSESNGGQSPRSDAGVLDDKPFGDYEYPQNVMETSNSQYSRHSPMDNNCVSPQAIQSQTAHSPSAFSHHTQSHRGSISEHLPSHPASPAKSIHSYHSPPGLCESSSSPAPSNHYYDLEVGSQHGEDMPDMPMNMTGMSHISEHDDEMFLEAFAAASTGGLTTLERDPDLLMGKFEDAFSGAAGDDLFRNSEDVFFGSP